MGVKKCFKCFQEKPISQFYKHKQTADGHLNKCKDCTKADSIKSRADNLAYYQEYDRARANLPHRVEKRKQIAVKWKNDPKLKKLLNERGAVWRQKNAIKRAAHLLVQYAVRKGDLLKLPCELCGKKKVEAHHDDYTKPLDVRWLCKQHHAEHHKKEREQKRNRID